MAEVFDGFKLGRSYTFNTLAPAILGAKFVNVKVLSMLSGEDAVTHNDVNNRHETLKGYISGLPKNASDCSFIKFKKSSGETFLLALEYINKLTAVLVDRKNLHIDILNTDDSSIEVVLTSLKDLGIPFTHTTTTE